MAVAAAFGLTVASAPLPSAAQDSTAMKKPRNDPPPSRRGRRVDLSGKKYKDNGFVRQLSRGAVGPTTNVLDLSGNRLTPRSIEALGSLDLPMLTSLTLDGSPIGDEGLLVLGRAATFRQLRTLSVARTGITAEGLAAFLATAPPALTNLSLDGNNIGDAGARALAGYKAGWTTLGLRAVGLSSQGASDLAGSGALDRCSYLDVADNGLDEASTDALWKPVSIASGQVVTE